MTSQRKFRIAPTPSGYLHIGNAINFCITALAATEAGATLLLRIDDLDAERKRPEYIEDIFQTIDWLGIHCDEGASGLQDFEQNWSQNLRHDHYVTTLATLRQQGVLFPCKYSRRELSQHEQYPDEWHHQLGITLDSPDVAWRIITPDTLPVKDFVVRRRDGIAAYQIASITDDRLFGITDVIRGEDLYPSTQAQIFLIEQLDWNAQRHINWVHHPLICNTLGQKLSKSVGDTALFRLREQGLRCEDIWQQAALMLARLLPLEMLNRT